MIIDLTLSSPQLFSSPTLHLESIMAAWNHSNQDPVSVEEICQLPTSTTKAIYLYLVSMACDPPTLPYRLKSRAWTIRHWFHQDGSSDSCFWKQHQGFASWRSRPCSYSGSFGRGARASFTHHLCLVLLWDTHFSSFDRLLDFTVSVCRPHHHSH